MFDEKSDGADAVVLICIGSVLLAKREGGLESALGALDWPVLP